MAAASVSPCPHTSSVPFPALNLVVEPWESFQGYLLLLKLSGKALPVLAPTGYSNINFHWSPMYMPSAPVVGVVLGGVRWGGGGGR